ncbi:MAG: tetratricopeptide repeat protein [Planctomycetota bacterium]|jgi:hypothetical protein
MKAEHRHELKTNELAQWISNFPDWAKKNRNTIIYVAIVLVVTFAAWLWKGYTEPLIKTRNRIQLTKNVTDMDIRKENVIRGQLQGTDRSTDLLTVAASLKSFAQNSKNKNMAALALIKNAQIIRTELHYRMETVSDNELKNKINNAKAAYTEALEKAAGNPILAAAAKFGIGLCEEEVRNFEAAKNIYSEIAQNSDFDGTPAQAQAKRRLTTIDEYKQKVVFAKLPEKAAQPAMPIQPQIQIPSIDVIPPNLPTQ